MLTLGIDTGVILTCLTVIVNVYNESKCICLPVRCIYMVVMPVFPDNKDIIWNGLSKRCIETIYFEVI